MKSQTFSLVLLMLLTVNCFSQDLQWVKEIDMSSSNEATCNAIDASGNTYIAGTLSSLPDFDPGPGTVQLPMVGPVDIFCAKYDADGNYEWAFRTGESGETGQRLHNIVVDAASNVYIVGEVDGQLDFDPGAGTEILSSPLVTGTFIAKYDTDGNYQWAKLIEGPSAGFDLALDSDNNIVVVGKFIDVVDFDPGPGTADIPGGLTYWDAYILKLDNDGNYMWAKNLTGTHDCEARQLAITDSDELVISGRFNKTIYMDPGTTNSGLPTSTGIYDAFMGKYTSTGDLIWGRSIFGTSLDATIYPAAMELTPSGDIYIGGEFEGDFDCDPSAATENVSSFTRDLFIGKYTGDGDFLWFFGRGALNASGCTGLAVGAYESVYVTGYCRPGVGYNLNPQGTAIVDNTWESALFYAQYGASGDFMNMYATGGTVTANDENRAIDIAIDNENSIYLLATADGSNVDLDPGPATLLNTGRNFVIAKHTPASLGVQSSESQESLVVFPNPVASTLTVALPPTLYSKTTIKLFDSVGKLIFSEEAANAETTFQMDVSAFAPGFYTLSLISDKTQYAQSLLIE